MSVLDYTGPITKVIFRSVTNPADEFGITLHTHEQDLESLEAITKRYREDGYKPIRVIKEYSVNGVIEPREAPVGPAGYRARSAFLRA